MPVHPSLRYWTEMNTGWALFAENSLNQPKKNYDPGTGISYGSTEPSDHGLFYGIDEYAKDFFAGKGFSGKYSPLQTADWLDALARETGKALTKGKELGASGAEFLAMQADLCMLMDLARYHAEKMRAAYALALWNLTKKGDYLSDAAVLLESAIGCWEALAQRGRENYHRDLNFSSAGSATRRGTWGDLTGELEADRKSLAGLLEAEGLGIKSSPLHGYHAAVLPLESGLLSASFPETVSAGKALDIEVKTASFGVPDTDPVLHYRHTNQTEGLFRVLGMEGRGNSYRAVIPADYVSPEWDLQIYVTVQGPSGSCVMLPGICHPAYPYPYHVVKVQ
jgi:hypothetical protein